MDETPLVRELRRIAKGRVLSDLDRPVLVAVADLLATLYPLQQRVAALEAELSQKVA